jgi:hypothetical protein
MKVLEHARVFDYKDAAAVVVIIAFLNSQAFLNSFTRRR